MNNYKSFLPFPVKVMATGGSRGLAEDVCNILRDKLPKELQPNGNLTLEQPVVSRFSNNNIQVQVPNVRGHYVVIIHTSTPNVNEELIELFALIDAVRNASPANLLLVFPNYPYARSDRKNQPRISTMAQCLAKLLNSLGLKKVILVDPHDLHIKHYFDPTADEISTIYLIIDYLERNFFTKYEKKDVTLVFPDAGASKRFDKVPEIIGVRQANINKERKDNSEDPTIGLIVGEVKDRICLLIDDELLTGSTAIKDAEKLKQAGAKSIFMVAIHAFLRDQKKSREDLIKYLVNSPIEQFIFTDTIPADDLKKNSSKFVILPTAGLLAETISRTVQNQSLTPLYDLEAVNIYRV